jgi:activator of HSP90 ATPase
VGAGIRSSRNRFQCDALAGRKIAVRRQPGHCLLWQTSGNQSGSWWSVLALWGHIIGRNMELLPNHRIVQAWRVVTWPEGVHSIAKFELKPHGSGTQLMFDHIGFPEGLHDHLADGWESNYCLLLKKYFH